MLEISILGLIFIILGSMMLGGIAGIFLMTLIIGGNGNGRD